MTSENKKCILCKIAGLLVVIGAINWGLVGILNFNLVSFIFGDMTTLSRVVYGAVGVSGVISVISCLKCCPGCKSCCNKSA